METRISQLRFGAWIPLIIGCLFLWSGCKTPTHYPALPIAFDRSTLVGSWIGFNDRDESLYRLVLNAGGDGVLYSQYQSGASVTNRIAEWKINGNSLMCSFQRNDSPVSPSLLKCEIKTSLLRTKLVGTGGWEENLLFRRDQFMEESLLKAKQFNP